MRKTRFIRFFRHLSPRIVRKIIVRSGRQRLPGLAAEIAFNAILAVFPATVAILTVVGLIGSSHTAFQELSAQLSRVAPQEVLNLFESFIQLIRPASSQSLLSISFIAALWVASGAVSSAMSALDQIHQIPRRWMRPFWRSKLVSLGLTLGTILLLVLASMILFISDLAIKIVASQGDELIRSVAKQPNIIEPQLLTLWYRLSLPIALGMVAIAFAFIYRFGPSRWIKGTPILPGAVLATIFWAIFSGIFRLYVSNFGNYNRVYGAVGAVVVLLLWLQLGALTMLIGAQLNVTVGESMRTPQRSLSNITQDRQDNAGKDHQPEKTSWNETEQRQPAQEPD